MKTQTKETQGKLTPKEAFNILVEGNKRFVQNIKAERNYKEQVTETSQGQFPFAVIHGCIDSRVPAEIIFDQGIGDIFNVRVAGNIINEDVLGSMEYSCKVAGSKILVVMGHTKCGAVTAACNHVELGNITPLLDKIKPALEAVEKMNDISGNDDDNSLLVEKVALMNIKLSINRIRKESPILRELEEEDKIEIIGALYSVETGEVEFLSNSFK